MSHAVTVSPQSTSSFERSVQSLRSSGMVRLDDVEAAALAAAIDGVVAESVELFGSRTDPASRGGDIDVFILTSAPRFETARRVSSRFFMHCEERIDVSEASGRSGPSGSAARCGSRATPAGARS